MPLVYEPNGKAREYSPLALNIYDGCDHLCKYCYVPEMMTRFNPSWKQSEVKAKGNGFLEKLDAELSRTKPQKQILLSFTGDPYCSEEIRQAHTRSVHTILNRHNCAVAILTKGGSRCLRDLDIFKAFGPNIKLGSTLTFDNDKDSLHWEPGGALPKDRVKTLKKLHEEGIKTFVSFEPVIKPAQSLNLIRLCLPFVDQFKVGRWNHDKEANKIDWASFLKESVDILRKAEKVFYVKHDLRKFESVGMNLRGGEIDPDSLALIAQERQNPLL
jgi:DNA repair photolyase